MTKKSVYGTGLTPHDTSRSTIMKRSRPRSGGWDDLESRNWPKTRPTVTAASRLVKCNEGIFTIMFISIEGIHLIYRFPSSPSLMFQFSSQQKIRTLPGPQQQKDMSHQWIFLNLLTSPWCHVPPLPTSRLVGDVSHHHSEDIVLERYTSEQKRCRDTKKICTPQVISSLKSCDIIIYIHIYLNRYKRWSWISQETWWWKGWILQILQRKRIRGLISLK